MSHFLYFEIFIMWSTTLKIISAHRMSIGAGDIGLCTITAQHIYENMAVLKSLHSHMTLTVSDATFFL